MKEGTLSQTYSSGLLRGHPHFRRGLAEDSFKVPVKSDSVSVKSLTLESNCRKKTAWSRSDAAAIEKNQDVVG